MKTLVGILLGGLTVVAVISVDKALGLSTKIVSTIGITPK